MQKKKVEVAGVSLSEAYALSEALSSLSELGEFGRESVIHARAQRAISSLNESFVSSRAQPAKLAKQKFTNSRLASLQDQKALKRLKLAKNKGVLWKRDVTELNNRAREKSLDEKPQPLRDSEFKSDY